MTRVVLVAAAFSITVASVAGQVTANGSIVGQVTLTRSVRGTPLPSNAYQPRAVARHDVNAAPELSNVVVYLKNVTFKGPLAAAPRDIVQKGEEFVPRVIAVTRGSTVAFPNGDPIFHNVFSLSGAAAFDLGRYPMGRSQRVTLNKPGLVKVFCHIHSHMSAAILVLSHPYFTVPASNGSFTLPDVPPGRYVIVGWHERVGERTATVDVVSGRATSVDLSLPLQDES